MKSSSSNIGYGASVSPSNCGKCKQCGRIFFAKTNKSTRRGLCSVRCSKLYERR